VKLLKKLLNIFKDVQLRGSITLTLSRIINAFFGFLFWFVIARFANIIEVGKSSSLISVLYLIGSLSTLGMDNALSQFGKKAKINIYIILILLGTSLISSIIYFLSFNVKEIYGSFVSVLVLFLSSSFLRSFTLTLDGYFICHSKFKWFILRILVENVTKFGSLFFFLNNIDFLHIIFSVFISLVLSSSYYLILLFVFKKNKPNIDNHFMNTGQLLKSGFSVHIGNTLYIFTPSILPTFLIIWKNETVSGAFYIVWMIANMFYAIINSLSIATVATVSDTNKKGGLKKLFLFYLVLIGTALITGVLLTPFLLKAFNVASIAFSLQLLRFLLYSSVIVAFYQYIITELRFEENFKKIAIINLIQSSIYFTLIFTIKLNLYELLGIGISFSSSILIAIFAHFVIKKLSIVSSKKNLNTT